MTVTLLVKNQAHAPDFYVALSMANAIEIGKGKQYENLEAGKSWRHRQCGQTAR